ncbi:acyl-CoA dehydrogenase family protein [Amaricoccus sp.]|uniref:acyl-CoA dehydrogenase family protein n=1 Tax=Amaricoccus sp. TaxID=1872485 RepID=UPI00260540EB|nr:acyl-CoA dehydrogenase family protein [Amaricoccus sp.]HRO10477.1 acyl-CoA dehydrogenase family protein [Amaricoccus sp.]
MIDFTLTSEQKALQQVAREFAQDVLKPIVREADAEPDPQKGFQMIKPAYEKAYELGFAMCFLPKEYGGGGVSNVDLLIAAEEITAVDPGFGCVLLVNGLALLPLVWFGKEEQRKKWLTLACNDPKKSFLAGWVVSEPAGSPGGTANFDHPSPQAGIQVTADLKNGEYVINGRKYWPSSAAGWDMQGADVSVVVVRTDRQKGGKGGLSCIIVPRGTPGVTYEPCIDTMGHRLNQNCDIRYDNVRVPEENVFALGEGDLVISKAFTWSGPVAGIAGVGVARTAYEYALNWAKTYTAGGLDPIIYHQNVGYMLTDVAMKIEAARYLSWKAAAYADSYDCENYSLGAMSKIFGGETAMQCVYDCMRVVGINSYDRRSHPFDKLMRDVLCFPIYDAGNMGMQRRKIWGMLAHPSFNPRSFVDHELVEFTREMEGIGSVTARPGAA